ncbi:MAG: hypothetical protein LBH40_03085 [Alphaproteobacteria bacterium]|jgi:hypothetical protein|nr:hypothetical protein [Alphaproteobacteria bacterium]
MNLIQDTNNLEKRYLIKDLTLEDLELLKNSNIECYAAYLTKKSRTDIEQYIYIGFTAITQAIEETYTTEEIIKIYNIRSGACSLEGYNIKEISREFIEDFDINRHIRLKNKEIKDKKDEEK